MFAKLTNSWELVKSSARVLQADKELIVFPIISGLALIVVSVSFFVPIAVLGAIPHEGASMIHFVLLYLFYFVQYTVMFFFNSALVGAAMIRLEGGNPTVGDGLRIAASRLGPILGYAAIAATVGLILRTAREKSEGLSRFVVGLLGMGWSLATFLVVPVLVTRDVGPIDALKESAATVKKTWGEQIIGNSGIGLTFGILSVILFLVAIPVMIAVIGTGQAALIAAAAICIVLGFILLSLVSATLSGIYAAALYRFATTGDAGRFDSGTLRQAFLPK